jgi:hypothetical protein
MGIIGGIEREILLAPLDDVLFILPSGMVQLQDGAAYEPVKFPEGSLSFEEPPEDTPSGVAYSAALSGQLSPVSEKVRTVLEKYAYTPFICIFKLKNGGAKVLGDTSIGCKLTKSSEVSGDISTNAYNVAITCRSTHESYFYNEQ